MPQSTGVQPFPLVVKFQPDSHDATEWTADGKHVVCSRECEHALAKGNAFAVANYRRNTGETYDWCASADHLCRPITGVQVQIIFADLSLVCKCRSSLQTYHWCASAYHLCRPITGVQVQIIFADLSLVCKCISSLTIQSADSVVTYASSRTVVHLQSPFSSYTALTYTWCIF
jgi:hypothetical protein